MKEFITKISLVFDVTDFELIATKDGFISTLKGYGCPNKWVNTITDENWEEFRDIVYDACK